LARGGLPNFDPRTNELQNVCHYDSDDREGVIGEHRGEREREAQRAEEIVRCEVEAFWRWFENLDPVPTIVELRDRAERICRHELARTLGSLRRLDEGERKSIESMAEAIMNKLLHPPISRLKRIKDAEAGDLLAARRLFGLDDEND